MFYEVQAIRKHEKTEHRLMGWWESDRDMIRQLNKKGYRVVSWTKR